jgi:hypothetical protein
MKPSYEQIAIESGIELWQGVAEELNEIIRQSGEIQRDNPLIWGGILHKWMNEDWAKVILVLRKLHREHPELFQGNNWDAVTEAEVTLNSRWDEHERLLDHKKYKKTAWKTLMSMREIWNRAQGVDLPNSVLSKLPPEPTPTAFEQLFEQ